MIKQFERFFLVLALLIGAMLSHWFVMRNSPSDALRALVKVTALSSPVLSVDYFSTRALHTNAPNPAYEEMPSLDRKQFIFER